MKQREAVLSRMEASVRDFVTERPDADYNAITRRFGSPEQIVATYLEEMDRQELEQELNSHRRIVRIVLTTAVIIICLWATVVFSALAEHSSRKDSYYVEKIVYETEIHDMMEGE